jgi:hypothetical protein
MTSFKRITDYTEQELDYTIEDAKIYLDVAIGPGAFYKILGGIDAYMERRRRRKAEAEASPTGEELKTKLQESVALESWNCEHDFYRLHKQPSGLVVDKCTKCGQVYYL